MLRRTSASPPSGAAGAPARPNAPWHSEIAEALADVDADHLDAASGQGVGVPPRPAADVEQPLPGPEPERPAEEADLLLGALGERVAQVGGAEVVGDRFEPVVGPVGFGHSGDGPGRDDRGARSASISSATSSPAASG